MNLPAVPHLVANIISQTKDSDIFFLLISFPPDSLIFFSIVVKQRFLRSISRYKVLYITLLYLYILVDFCIGLPIVILITY